MGSIKGIFAMAYVVLEIIKKNNNYPVANFGSAKQMLFKGKELLDNPL